MTELNDLNRKIREALALHPDLRTDTLKLAQAHYAGELTNTVLDRLMDLIMANKVARPTTRRLSPRLVIPLLNLMSEMTANPGAHYIHLSRFADLKSTDVSLLRFWGLAEQDPSRRGYYTLTRMFFLWASGVIRIPSELIFNGGGAAVKYQPGKDMTSLAQVLDEVGWQGPEWDPSRSKIAQWQGHLSRLHLHSRDWCGGVSTSDVSNPEVTRLLWEGAEIIGRQNEAMSRPAET